MTAKKRRGGRKPTEQKGTSIRLHRSVLARVEAIEKRAAKDPALAGRLGLDYLPAVDRSAILRKAITEGLALMEEAAKDEG